MHLPFWIAPALLALAGTSATPAQDVGASAPEVEFKTQFNFGKIEVKKLSDLRGSAVLLEFWGVH